LIHLSIESGRDVKIRQMRSALPFILVLLAVFTAGCIAYIAWELSSDKGDQNKHKTDQDSSDAE